MSLMALMRAFSVLAALSPVASWWDGKVGTKDPYTQAMEMSRRAHNDPDLLRKDPDFYKRMFGNLAIEQSQAQAMDETQSYASADDLCMVCHGMVAEFELMVGQERKGHGKRDSLMATEALEDICHLNRYQILDGLNPTKREEPSRKYGGIAPPVFAQACKKVVMAWDDHDEVEGWLIAGGSPAGMHRELRERVCNGSEGVCHGLGVEVEEKDGKLSIKGKEEQCSADGGKKKKKKKKATSKGVPDSLKEPTFELS
uniref:Saposin B-type domain-containing protein n=1 Tax=Haptolina brevifila TaxID=156173 RepID=A0A7S2JPA5_9EUKA|mmetsp:Transcript_86600/g.172850  ORF Transcript_86600/g.172850 Transcript_86600/m.172850 type:complete len:256 (+) Transcript_86600:27-794(+)